jgi:hypothetical protein
VAALANHRYADTSLSNDDISQTLKTSRST